MDDRKFEEVLGELPRTFRPPVDPRYDEMWTAIEAAHFDAPAKRTDIRRRTLTALPWLAAAAALFIGIAIGRDTAKKGLPMMQPVVATAPGQTATTNSASDTYRDEITRYLAQAAALLIALPSPTGPDRFVSASNNTKLADKASDLLVTTRLLLDSPAAQDPQLHSLLEDLELVFAQIARLRVEKSKSDLDLIHQAVEQGNVLSRLNSVVTNPSAE
jgi:uncharacterized membrane-anchored protein YhcB (DUF1043 family)